MLDELLEHEVPRYSPRCEVRDAVVEDVYALVENLREADRKEITDLGVKPKRAIYRAFRNSLWSRTAFVDDEIAAMWGLCVGMRPGVSALSPLAVPWLHTTPAAERIPLSFVKIGKQELLRMRANRRLLESFVAADYPKAIKFIRLIGFTVEAPVAIGDNGARFCRFHLGFDA